MFGRAAVNWLLWLYDYCSIAIFSEKPTYWRSTYIYIHNVLNDMYLLYIGTKSFIAGTGVHTGVIVVYYTYDNIQILYMIAVH